MSVAVETGTSVGFDRFWHWLQEHRNCILEGGTPDCYLLDHEAFHWQLGEDEEQGPYVQLFLGKQIVGEILLEPRDILFVQARLDATEAEPDQHVFELIGGSPEEPFPLYRFVMAHGIEDERAHPGALKH